MKEKFTIEKKIDFNNNIAEITTISLEEKHDIDNQKLLGNFIVSGEYKIHEISINKEKFNYKIPYSYDLKSDIDLNTVDATIENFIYDTEDNYLYVTIDYEVSGDRKDILLFDDKEDLNEFLKSREVEILFDEASSEIEDVLNNKLLTDDEKEVIREECETKDLEDSKTIINEVKIESEDENIKENNENLIRNIDKAKEELLNSIKLTEDNYITYKIHIVSTEDSIESIMHKYNIALEDLKEYNAIDSLKLGDKLIIPINNE